MNVDPWTLAVGAAVAALVLPRLLVRRAPPAVVAEKLRAGARVIDVRSQGEFEGGAFPGAVNIPLPSLRARLREIPTGVPVIVYCASGMRSASAVSVLRRAGYADVVNAGGLRHMPA